MGISSPPPPLPCVFDETIKLEHVDNQSCPVAYSTTLLRGKEKIVDEDHASSLLKHVDDLLDCID